MTSSSAVKGITKLPFYLKNEDIYKVVHKYKLQQKCTNTNKIVTFADTSQVIHITQMMVIDEARIGKFQFTKKMKPSRVDNRSNGVVITLTYKNIYETV